MKNTGKSFFADRKRWLLCLFLILLIVYSACGKTPADRSFVGRTREFEDSLGRTVTIPEELVKIAMTGPLTQIYVFPLCPDRLAGFSVAFSENAKKYIPEKVLALPELGQLHGGKGTMNLEQLLAVSPDAVIDMGEPKFGMTEEFDRLTKQTGIPFIHIDADIATAPEAYRMLGRLTGDTAKAEQLSAWCEKTNEEIKRCMMKVDAEGKRAKVLYCLGPNGLHVLAENSYHAQIVSLCADMDKPVSDGDGNPVDMEQLMLWDPDVILFRHDSICDEVAADELWQQLRAVKNNTYYKIPGEPYGWLSSPPGVQCCLGMLWLTDTLYPEYTDFDLKTEVTEYYRLFYGCELSEEDYEQLVSQTTAAA